jgi:hypothetical protein
MIVRFNAARQGLLLFALKIFQSFIMPPNLLRSNFSRPKIAIAELVQADLTGTLRENL